MKCEKTLGGIHPLDLALSVSAACACHKAQSTESALTSPGPAGATLVSRAEEALKEAQGSIPPSSDSLAHLKSSPDAQK